MLWAYGIGLTAVILLRPFVSAFHARGDTTTPMLVAIVAVGTNVAAKIALIRVTDIAGLAYATSLGL